MAVTANNAVAMKSKLIPIDGMRVNYPVAATTAIYKNSFVGLSATGYLTSYVAPAEYTGATATGTKFVGIACEQVASQTSDGDKTCLVQIDGYFEYTLASIALLDVGCPVCASDNSTLVMTPAIAPAIGTIIQYSSSTTCIVKLFGPGHNWTGKWMFTSTGPIDLTTAGTKMLIVHETDNIHGLFLYSCNAVVTEAIKQATTAAVVTIQHTADMSMGCTITVTDNNAVGDLEIGSGGCMIAGADTASGGNLVVATANKQINAEVTTAGVEAAGETGELNIYCIFVSA